MSLFDKLVNAAMSHQQEYAPLRVVVEKELLHHDILREMSRAGLLTNLTLVGGTSLRICYGSSRLSEDLDFTGGCNFNREDLGDLAKVLTGQLKKKYSLVVSVSEPTRESGNVDTWKLSVVTRPAHAHLPQQRIHIDICAIPSYEPSPMMLRNHYGVDMGTSGLILQVQSRKEILADKIVAFGLRRNRVKNRDLWDICWLVQQNVGLDIGLVYKKVNDHKQELSHFKQVLSERVRSLEGQQAKGDFLHEMGRFLPPRVVRDTVSQDGFWTYLSNTMLDLVQMVLRGEGEVGSRQ